MKIESDTHYFAMAADVVLRTAITQTMFAELAQMQAFKHMQAVKLVADAYELHAYFTKAPDADLAAFVAEWIQFMGRMGHTIKANYEAYTTKPNGNSEFKAYDVKGRYCGRLSAANGRATIINWRGTI